MKRLNIIGIGPGNLNYLCEKGKRFIIDSDVIIGSRRQIDSISPLTYNQLTLSTNKISEIISSIENLENEGLTVTVLLSGDTGFYSALEYLNKNLPMDIHKKIEVIPGISSYQYLFSKLKKCWHEYLLSSLHGRDNQYIELLKLSNKGIILLTDSNNHWSKVVENLKKLGYGDCKIIIGENLSYEDEKIITFYAKDYKSYDAINNNPSIIVIEK